MERFACETMILSGEGALEALGELQGKRLLLVTERMKPHSTVSKRIREQLRPESFAAFEDAAPEPTMSQAVAGVKRVKEFCPDLVVALGGSYVLDCAKAMVGFSGKRCPLAVIPMEAGSGTETTDTVTLTHDGRRHTFRDKRLRPDLAILDSSLLTDCPAGKVAEGGFELLAASLQAYLGKQAGMLTALHAREAFSAGWGALPAAFSGSIAARRRLQTASAMAGIAYTRTGLGLCRAMTDSVGSVFHLSPGCLSGILLPAVVGCNSHAAGRRLAELARAAGMGGSSEAVGVRNLKAALARLRQELGMPATLAQAGIDPRWVWGNANRIVELTLENPQCRNNPVAVDDFLVRRILEEITGRF